MSSEIKKCANCRGTKKVAGMGFVKKDCPFCKGIGYIEEAPKKAQKKKKAVE